MLFWGLLLLAAVALLLLLGAWLVVLPRLRCQRKMQGYNLAPPFLLPALPKELDRKTAMPSRAKPLVKYRLNLYRLSCTCQSFRQWRGCFPDNDIHRLCRHLRKALQNTSAINLYDAVTQRIIQDRVRDKYYHRLTLLGTDMVFGYHLRSNYMRIFTRRRLDGDPQDGPFTGPYDKFVFNLPQENWIYGEAPPGSSQITAAAILLMERMRPLAQQLHKQDQPPETID